MRHLWRGSGLNRRPRFRRFRMFGRRRRQNIMASLVRQPNRTAGEVDSFHQRTAVLVIQRRNIDWRLAPGSLHQGWKALAIASHATGAFRHRRCSPFLSARANFLPFETRPHRHRAARGSADCLNVTSNTTTTAKSVAVSRPRALAANAGKAPRNAEHNARATMVRLGGRHFKPVRLNLNDDLDCRTFTGSVGGERQGDGAAVRARKIGRRARLEMQIRNRQPDRLWPIHIW